MQHTHALPVLVIGTRIIIVDIRDRALVNEQLKPPAGRPTGESGTCTFRPALGQVPDSHSTRNKFHDELSLSVANQC